MKKKQILYLGNKVSKHGFNKTTIETLGPLLEKEGYTLRYASEKKSQVFRLLEMLYIIVRYSRSTDYILIDTYSTLSFIYAFCSSQLARLLKIKYIPILHGGNLPSRLKKNPYLSNLVFNNATICVAPSNYLKTKFEELGYTNLVFIPNTVEINKYEFLERINIVPNLLWVRAFSKIYNPAMAIEVFKLVKEKYPASKLCMIGPDKDGSMNYIKELVSKYELDVEITGRLSIEEWTTKSKQFDVFINTTHFDNTPISVIEAMALGLPVVSTNVGGIPYLVANEENALLVSDNDVQGMFRCIVRLVEEDNLSLKLSKNGNELIESFDWDVVKKIWIGVLG